MMKKTLLFLTITFLLFILSSVVTYKDELQVDGLLTYGFPFTIYEACGDCVSGFESGYSWENVFKNLIIYGLISFTITFLINKIKK